LPLNKCTENGADSCLQLPGTRRVSQNAVFADDSTSAILGTGENTLIYKGEKCQTYQSCCHLRKEFPCGGKSW